MHVFYILYKYLHCYKAVEPLLSRQRMEDELDTKPIPGKLLFYSFMNLNVKFKEAGWLTKLSIRSSLRYFKSNYCLLKKNLNILQNLNVFL